MQRISTTLSILSVAIAICGLPHGIQPCFAAEEAPKAEKPAETPSTADDEEEPEEAKERYLAVIGGVVHTASGPVLNGATILAKDGKIVAIGHGIAVPEEAEILDATGLHVYPGLIAVNSSGIVGREPPEDNTDVFGLNMTLALAGGITTVVTGNSAAKLSFGTLEDHVLKRNLFYKLQYNTSNPDSRRKLRANLGRVQQYLREVEAYEEAKKRDADAKAPDKAWLKGDYETARKLLQHETVGIADANTSQDLRELSSLAERYDLRIVIRGVYEGWIVAAELGRANLQAIVTPRTSREASDRLNRPNGSSIENARILHERGVRFAIVPASAGTATWGIAGRDLMTLPMEAAFAVRGGLPDEAAVRAITIDAAAILGVQSRVGSIEVGKDADFAIVDGDLLHYMTMVRWTVVNGRVAYDKNADSLLNHIRPEGDRNAPPPADYWPRSLGDPFDATPQTNSGTSD